MIVISNTTPIITLLKVDKLEILKKLFGEIYISKGVYDELVTNNTFQEEAKIIKECEFIKVKNVHNEFAVKLLQIAKSMAINLTGTLGILVKSKEMRSNF